MLNSIRSQILLFHGLLEKNEHATAVVARRDLGVLHDHLLEAETALAVVSIEILHEFKKTFTDKTPKQIVQLIDKVIEHVDGLRKNKSLPPSGPFAPGTFDEPKKPGDPEPVKTAEAPEEKLAPIVPFEKPAEGGGATVPPNPPAAA